MSTGSLLSRETGLKLPLTLAWRFFVVNKPLSLLLLAVLFGLQLLGMIPLVGLLFSIAGTILSYAAMIYVSRLGGDSESPEAFEEAVKAIDLKILLAKYWQVAAGGWLGTVAVSFLLIAAVMVVGFATGGAAELMQVIQSTGEGNVAGWPQDAPAGGVVALLLIALLLFACVTYLYPLVIGAIMVQEDFGGAFKAAFGIFSPALWAASFRGAYFLLILVASAVAFLASIVIALTAATVILIPLAILVAYWLMLYVTFVFTLSRIICLGGDR